MLSKEEFDALLLKWTPFIRMRVKAHSLTGEFEDVVQDVMMDACARRDQYDPARGSFAAWLWWRVRARVQINNARANLRAGINLPVDEHEDGEQIVEARSHEPSPLELLELRETLDTISGELRERDVYVVLQRAVGNEYRVIGQELGLSIERVRQLCDRGARQLKRHLDPDTVRQALC